ncbi:unnamed protein product [Tenebrio molitor]|nr:unnamed protein product [Tenebrio molitor]
MSDFSKMNRLVFLLIPMLYLSANSWPMEHAPILPPSVIVVAPFSNLSEITNKKIAQVIDPAKAISLSPHFPTSGRRQAVLEQESLISKADSAYSKLQHFVASFYNPKPIVDTIQEHEKYGNDGEKFRSVGVAIVGGYEAVSNLLNAAVEVPFETAKQFSKKITATLNSVGEKIVGL